MKWLELAQLPTVVTSIPPGTAGVHESTLRVFHMHRKVVDYLRRGVPGPVIIELLEELDLLTALLQRIEQFEAQRARSTTAGSTNGSAQPSGGQVS